ncbi:MAG: redox-sensing transcriptional repressor Rex [Candidatus Hydrogenedentes bacterium]|nr:redox-sensing transcriptional repressor Rex [Candidatus Hydrogenedentota bacterium]
MSHKQGKRLSHAVVERLMHYYYFIGEQITEDTDGAVSSAELARLLEMDDTQVRKDLASIGVRGQPRKGFQNAEVLTAIRRELGFNFRYDAIVLGAGRLGGAIVSYGGFNHFGLKIIALFDDDPSRTGEVIGGTLVHHIDELERFIERHDVHLAILTVPHEAAQPLADRLVKSGITGIWNFAPTRIEVPEHVHVRHEHIAVGLAQLAYYLKPGPDAPA